MYKVKFGGKKGKSFNLVESPDLVAIRTKNNQELESLVVSKESKAIINDSTMVAEFPEAGVSIRRVNMESELESTVNMRDQARTTLKQEKDIKFAGRVLQEEKTGQVMLYTENFFVKFLDKISEKECLSVIEKYHLKIKNKLVFATNSYFVQAPEGTGLEVFNIAEHLLSEKSVEFCHPEIVQERRFKAIHPLQWHLSKTVFEGKEINQSVEIEKAWAFTKGKGITIAIVDDGVDVTHPEFAGRIVHQRDVTMEINDGMPKKDDDNHGTACAGVAAGAGLPGGASGTAPEAFIMPIRLSSGLGSMAEANAFAWAADNGADVISCSWGPTDGNWWDLSDPTHTKLTPLPDSTRLAMDYALTKGRKGSGCVILFAAGNGNEDTRFDGYASNPNIITVAASNDTGKRSVYSDYGKSVWVTFPSGDFAFKVFKHPSPIMAGIRTTDRVAASGYTPENYVNSFGGTSSSCPGMAGLVALMLAVNPKLTPPEVKEIIKNSCEVIDKSEGEYDANGHSIYYGYGRINAGLLLKNTVKAGKSKENTTPQIKEQSLNSTTKTPQKQVNSPKTDSITPGPSVEGTVKFSSVGEVRLKQGELVGNFVSAKKIVGFSLRLKAAEKGLKLRYKANVAGEGIIENVSEGDFIGSDTGRKKLIGFALNLEGPGAEKYEVEYSARFQKSNDLLKAKNGVFCGTDKKTGNTLEAIEVNIRSRV
jgi:subtilisin family serine protease